MQHEPVLLAALLGAAGVAPSFECPLEKRRLWDFTKQYTHQSRRLPRASEHELVHRSSATVAHLLVHHQRTHVKKIQRVPRLEHPARHAELTVVLEIKKQRGSGEKKQRFASESTSTSCFAL